MATTDIEVQSRKDLVPTKNESGSFALTTVPDVATDMQVIATKPEHMLAAQGQIAEWFSQKMLIAQKDVEDCKENLAVAVREGWQTKRFSRQLRAATGRLNFYDKCLQAVEAGYVIVPNFPVDVFAIRTTKKKPKYTMRELNYKTTYFTEEKTNSPPAGEGNYQNPDVWLDHSTRKRRNKDGEIETVHRYTSGDWGEIEFPVNIAQPMVMESTAKALALEVFDEVGGLPGRKKGDPIVIGNIYPPNDRYHENPVSFLIAWWIDTRQLP